MPRPAAAAAAIACALALGSAGRVAAQPRGTAELPPGDLPALHDALWLSGQGIAGLFSPLGSYGLELELGHRRWSVAVGAGHALGEFLDQASLELSSTLRARLYPRHELGVGGGLGLSHSLGPRDVFDGTLERPTWLNPEVFVERAYGRFVMRGALGLGIAVAMRRCTSHGEPCDARGQLVPFVTLTVGYAP